LRCAQIFGNDERKNVLYEYEIGYLVELYFGSYVYIFSNDYVDVLQHVDTDDDIYGNVDGGCSNDVYNECLIGEVVGDMPCELFFSFHGCADVESVIVDVNVSL
jgi:hypothetical protein